MSGDRARISVTVTVPPPLAFELFTAQIDRWWLRGPKFRWRAGAGFIRIEPQVGGRLFESVDGAGGASVFEVGRVRVWDPPRRLCFSWRGTNFAANEETQVEVEFMPAAVGTVVTVTHSGLSDLHVGHPARHGQQGAGFSRMTGLWWGELLSSLRQVAAACR